MIVWVAEEVLDHEAGWVRGVFSTRERAIESVITENPSGTWIVHDPDERGHFSIDDGRQYGSTCVSIEPHEVDP